MKLTDFLKDRLTAYLIYGISWVLMLIFMAAFCISLQAIIIVSTVLFLGAICVEMWEFLRKKSYYDKLLNYMNELDKKYLLSEMVEEPEFLDGQIFYEVLQETDKSMNEHIAEYRRENKDFREYIEMWVHEIKLPVASLQLMCHNDNNSKYSEQLRRIDDYIENVLYYARSGNAEKDYIIKPVALKRVFADIAIKNRSELQERNITLKTENLDMNVMICHISLKNHSQAKTDGRIRSPQEWGCISSKSCVTSWVTAFLQSQCRANLRKSLSHSAGMICLRLQNCNVL